MKLFGLLLIPLLVLAAGCEDADWDVKDATGFSKSDRADAMHRHLVIPGMTADQVTRVWDQPQGKKASGAGEEWIYYSGDVGQGFEVHTSVKFVQGKVTDVTNGDLMANRPIDRPRPDGLPLTDAR